MKQIALLVAVFFTGIVIADDVKTNYQTLPNSNIRDYRSPAHVTKGDVMYQTLPASTIRDYPRILSFAQ